MDARKLNFLPDLPHLARNHLLCFLDVGTLTACCCVCKSWNDVISSDGDVWKSACQKLNLHVDEGERREARHWKSYALSIIQRKKQMKKSVCFVTSPFTNRSPAIKAIYYHNEKLAVAYVDRIEIWTYVTNNLNRIYRMVFETSGLKFDDEVMMTGNTNGSIVSWHMTSGVCIAFYRGTRSSLTSFDYLNQCNIVAGSYLNSTILIWNFSTGALVEWIDHMNDMIVKVLLAPKRSEGASRQQVVFLFSLDIRNICVRTLKFDPSNMTVGNVELNLFWTLRLDPVERMSNSFKITGSLLFDGQLLYYLKSSPLVLCNTICMWDVYENKIFQEKKLQDDVKSLLAVGKKYIAIHTVDRNGREERFIVTKKLTTTEVAVCKVPNDVYKSGTLDNNFLIIGEKSWLDGLNGLNDRGLLYACIVNNDRLHSVTWTQRIIRAF